MTTAHVLIPDGADVGRVQRALELVARNESALNRIEAAFANEQVPVGPATAAMLAELDAKWRSVERDYGAYATSDVAAILHVQDRSSVHRARTKNGLVSYKRTNRVLYPAFQFHQGKAIDMHPVTAPLRDAGWSDDDIIMWLISANAYTPDNEPPVAALVRAIDDTATGHVEVPATLATLATEAAGAGW